MTRTMQEFIEYCKSIRNPYHFETNEFQKMIGFVISEVIAEHEQKAWKPYPENEPIDARNYQVTIKQVDRFGNYQNRVKLEAVSYDRNTKTWSSHHNYIVAFRNLPEPYLEKGDER